MGHAGLLIAIRNVNIYIIYTYVFYYIKYFIWYIAILNIVVTVLRKINDKAIFL